MYSPVQWVNLTNTVFPEVFRIVEGEAQGNGNVTKRSKSFRRRCASCVRESMHGLLTINSLCSLVKRAENQTQPYTTSAILCGDGKDPGNVTMTDIFQTIISASRNISHMCTFILPCYSRIPV